MFNKDAIKISILKMKWFQMGIFLSSLICAYRHTYMPTAINFTLYACFKKFQILKSTAADNKHIKCIRI